mmetsp:Transcript_6481/g.25968  ORF Transcript_6481/g.25968 Transcript_6481/m.25968 type:complete len:388 (+) Transcript_6481:1315-2478(+)
MRRTVGVERVLFRRRSVGVDVSYGGLAVLQHVGQHALIWELDFAFTVRAPNAHARSPHALQHHRWCVFVDADSGPSRFKATAVVVNETRLPGIRKRADAAVGRDEAQERHELATVAHTQRERVRSVVKVLELLLQRRVVTNTARPSLGAIEDVGVRETADEDDAAEIAQVGATAKKVAHGDIPRLHTGGGDSSGHLSIAVRPFFSDNGNFGLVRRVEHFRRRRSRRVRQLPRRRLARFQAFLLDSHCGVGGLKLFKLKTHFLPLIAKRRCGIADALRAASGYRALAVVSSLPNRTSGDSRGGVRRHDVGLVLRRDFENNGEFFGETRRNSVISGKRHIYTRGGGRESHLEHGGDEAAVGDVVTSANLSPVDELLRRAPRRLEIGGVI